MNFGPFEIALIFLAILLIFGAKRIPEIARGLGKGIREFRDATNDIKHELTVGDQPPPPARQVQPPTYAQPPAPQQPAQPGYGPPAQAQPSQPAQAPPPAPAPPPPADGQHPTS